MGQRRLSSLALFLITTCLSISSGCGAAVQSLSGEPASYQDVAESWGGIALGHIVAESTGPVLLLELHPDKALRIDSGICVARVSTRIAPGTLYLVLFKSICGERSLKTLAIPLEGLADGSYEVRYDDEAANYPKLGALHATGEAVILISGSP